MSAKKLLFYGCRPLGNRNSILPGQMAEQLAVGTEHTQTSSIICFRMTEGSPLKLA